MTSDLVLRWLQRGFLLSGLLLVALWSRTTLEARRFQSSESRKLEAALREAESDPSLSSLLTASVVGRPGVESRADAPEGNGVLGRIEIPRLGITAIVAEGVDLKTLSRAVGHVTQTAQPGSPGNCALAGHRDTFLRGLGNARVNDVIRIVTRERTYLYQVQWSAVVEPERVDLLNATATRSLTLITCYPFAYVGHAPQRYVIRARQVDAVRGQGERGVFPVQDLTTERR